MKVGVVGLGLIGGSFAKAYSQEGHTVLGYNRNRSVLAFASISGAVSGELTEENISECDLVLISVYPEAAVEFMKKMGPYIGQKPVVIDCCGTKQNIVERGTEVAREYGFTFVGGHPMAGTQYSGFKYSRADLYKGAPMVIVPPDFSDIHLLSKIKDLKDALCKDLGRHEVEAYLLDIGTVILEINEAIHGVRRWARPERHFSGLVCFPSVTTRVYKMPYGVSLIVSPFNFPILLSLGVLAASIAGGNTAVIKTSSKTPNCTAVLNKIISEVFPKKYCAVVDGGHDVADFCLGERFDKIFYTGSPRIGVHVLEQAAKNLTSTALELGGETGNWAVVRKDADLRDAARKIAFFKICNSGQICININQVAVAEEVAEDFMAELKKEIIRQIGEHPCDNPEYSRLVSKGAYDKCSDEAEMYRDRIVFGGNGDPEELRYDTTLIYPVDIDEPIVMHELFCPLLPIVPFKDSEVEALMRTIAEREHGLSLYLFTKDIKWAKKTMQTQQFGGGCINEVCIHLMVKGVPFNGTGHSGLGAYHGVWGFREFTHPQTVLIGKTHFNLPLREHPYGGKKTKRKLSLAKFVER